MSNNTYAYPSNGSQSSNITALKMSIHKRLFLLGVLSFSTTGLIAGHLAAEAQRPILERLPIEKLPIDTLPVEPVTEPVTEPVIEQADEGSHEFS